MNCAAFEQLRKARVAIEDLRALVDLAVLRTAGALIPGSPFDDQTEAVLSAVKRDIIDELTNNKRIEGDADIQF